MVRRFVSSSVDQLEAALEKALSSGDRATIKALSHELTFRRVPRARELAERIASGQTSHGIAPRREGSLRASHPTPQAGSASRPKFRNPPTPEQEKAIDGFGTIGSLRINAYAGTGKTSTLEMLAHSTRRRGQYIAFNRSIVDDAKARFPNTVDCATTHGLAYRGTPPAFRQGDKMTGKTSAQQLAEILNLKKGWRVDREHTLQPRSQAFLILETVRRFAQSADENLSIVHVPQHGSLATASDETLAAVSDFAIRGATHIWGRMCNAQDSLPLGHDGYLKLWALSKPLIAADFIMLDEAQDTNPVVLEVLRHQSSQLVYVGDRYQQIYEWRGAINAMESMNTDITARLTQSFRFGPDIAAGASQLLRLLGEVVPLAGNPLKVGRIGPCEPTTILSRTNASVMTSLVDVLNSGKSPHLVGGTGDLMDMLKGVQDLKAGTASTVPDFFGFQTWEEVVEFAKSAEGEHLLTFTNLVQARGEKQLMWALRRTVEEDKADIILSTAHKSKGREWKNVRLTDDFMKTRPSKSTDAAEQDRLAKERAAEMRLLYVAITRAKENIDVPAPLLAMLGVTGQLSVPLAASAGTSPKPPSDRTAGWQPPVDWKEKSLPPQPSASIKPPKQVKRGLISRLFGW